MFKCECGSEDFYAHDDETIIVYYDGSGEELDGGDIIDSVRPGWNKAFHCSGCDKEYSSLPPQEPEEEWLRERERRYLNQQGVCCPICESGDIEGIGSLHVDGTNAWQKVWCRDCDSEWEDIYHLRGVEIDNYPTNMVPKGITKSEKIDPNEAFKK